MAAWRSIGILSLVLGIAPTSSQADEARHALAEELVRTMKADEQASQRIERIIIARCREEQCDDELRLCLFKIDHNELMLYLVSFAERELTPEEMKAAIAYFRSEIGEKHRQVMRAEVGLSKATLYDQTSEARAAMLAFLDTPAGYRLVTRALLTNTDKVSGMVLNHAGRAFSRCKP
jgi:hypothetical protein